MTTTSIRLSCLVIFKADRIAREDVRAGLAFATRLLGGKVQNTSLDEHAIILFPG